MWERGEGDAKVATRNVVDLLEIAVLRKSQQFLSTDNQFNDSDMAEFSKALANERSLSRILLPGNEITAEGLAFFTQLMQKNPVFTSLSFSRNPLGDEGARLLGDVLEKGYGLSVLHAKACDFHEEGFSALAKGVERNKRLEELHCGFERRDMQADLTGAFHDLVAGHPSLYMLDLEGGMNDADLIALASGLKDNTILRNISLAKGHYGKDGIMAMSRYLAENQTLVSLEIDLSGAGQEGVDAFVGALKQNRSLVSLRLTCDPGMPADELVSRVADAFQSSGNRNFNETLYINGKSYFTGKHPPNKMLNTTYNMSKQLEKPLQVLSNEQLAGIQRHIGRICYNYGRAKEKDFMALCSNFKPLPEELAGYFTGNPAPIENPQLWSEPKTMNRILAQVIKAGPEWLEKTTERGETIIEIMARYRPPGEWVQALNKHGISVKENAFSQGRSSLYTTLLGEPGTAKALLSRSNCAGMTRQEVRELYQALPDAQLKGIGLVTVLPFAKMAQNEQVRSR